MLSVPDVPLGHRATCTRCGITLARPHRGGFGAALACTVLGAAFLPLSLLLPLMNIREAGRFSLAQVMTGPEMMERHGLWLLAAAVMATFLAVPAVRLGLLFAALLGVRTSSLTDWSYGPSGGSSAALPTGCPTSSCSASPSPSCASPQSHTPSSALPCDKILHKRKPDSISRSWALIVTGVLLYVPANVLPMMRIEHLGRRSESTILGGVLSLFHAGAWPLGLVVFVASVSVPLLKLLALGTALVLECRGATRGLRSATIVHHVVGAVGRWSMLDMFALTTLVGLVHMGSLVHVRPGAAALPFCMLALITMLAAELFDTRLMWDAAARAHRHAERTGPALELSKRDS